MRMVVPAPNRAEVKTQIEALIDSVRGRGHYVKHVPLSLLRDVLDLVDPPKSERSGVKALIAKLPRYGWHANGMVAGLSSWIDSTAYVRADELAAALKDGGQ